MVETLLAGWRADLLACRATLLALVSALDAYLAAPSPETVNDLARALAAAKASLRER